MFYTLIPEYCMSGEHFSGKTKKIQYNCLRKVRNQTKNFTHNCHKHYNKYVYTSIFTNIESNHDCYLVVYHDTSLSTIKCDYNIPHHSNRTLINNECKFSG